MGEPVLTYDLPAPTGPPVAAICGLPAAAFAAAVYAATVAENHGLIAWRGLTVLALWTCLVTGPVLAVVGLVAGVRTLRRPGGRRRSAAVGLAAAAAALATYALWFAYVVH